MTTVLVAVAGRHGATAEIAREIAAVLRRDLPAADIEITVVARGHQVFAGRLDPADLRWAERLAVRAVHAPTGDFRDHDAIRAWAVEVASDVARHDRSVDTVARRPCPRRGARGRERAG